MKEYAAIILPLAFGQPLTYHVPTHLREQVKAGSCVIVPIGARKYCTGVVMSLSDERPQGDFKVKDIAEVVDLPSLFPKQLQLWQWIAHYYMCTPGEVMRAALPTGLKVESETFLRLNPDEEGETPLTENEERLVALLQDGKLKTVGELQRKLDKNSIIGTVRKLLEKEVIIVGESLVRRYKPRKEKMLRLAEAYRNDEALEQAFMAIRQAKKQTEALTAFLDFTHAPAAFNTGNMLLLEDLSKATFEKRAGCTPAIVRALAERGIIEIYEREVERLKVPKVIPNALRKALSEEQQRAIDEVKQAWKDHDICLLHGVTSSGKTEVYIHLIEEAIERGEQVLYLLPEIALTTQITQRLGKVFGEKMGIYHSKYPDNERVELWKKQLSDQPFPLILGVRSSIFLPFHKLGLIIIDEEHENSYKQQDPAPRYHARDAALVMARFAGAKTLLGTATPSIETYAHTQSGKYGLVEMFTRFGDRQLPEIVVEDMKELQRVRAFKPPFTPHLLREMREALAAKEQIILFQNRRGYAPVMECQRCGWTPRCKACDVTLTVHKSSGKLVCHYCGATYHAPTHCPQCELADFQDKGFGTERIESVVHQYFPEARTQRMDLDTTSARSSYDKIIDNFSSGQTDILIGTQMVTKGLDFEKVHIVGILNADQTFNVPDFRANERAFQMLSQVAGRAGRKGRRGKVILQTRQADRPVVKQIVQADYAALYAAEMAEREAFVYPPFCRIIHILVRHRDERICADAAEKLRLLLQPTFQERLLGPDRPAVSRVKHLFIRKFLLKVTPNYSGNAVRQTLQQAQTQLLARRELSGTSIIFDVDPY